MTPAITRDRSATSAPVLLLRRDLLQGLWTDAAIARMVDSGLWVRIRNGAYVETSRWRASSASTRHRLLAQAVSRQAATVVIVSHVSSVPFYGGPLWKLDLSEVHVTRPDGRTGRVAAGVHQHRGVLIDGDVQERHGVAVTTPARLVVEVASCSATAAALAVANFLLHTRQLTMGMLIERYESMQGWPGTQSMAIVLRLADERIESVGESRFFHFCFLSGLPMPELQREVRDSTGRVLGYLDFLFEDQKVWVEFDGKEKYLKFRRPGESVVDAVLREKKREDAIREATGWRCIRITWADLEDPVRLARRLATFLFPGDPRAADHACRVISGFVGR